MLKDGENVKQRRNSSHNFQYLPPTGLCKICFVSWYGGKQIKRLILNKPVQLESETKVGLFCE